MNDQDDAVPVYDYALQGVQAEIDDGQWDVAWRSLGFFKKHAELSIWADFWCLVHTVALHRKGGTIEEAREAFGRAQLASGFTPLKKGELLVGQAAWLIRHSRLREAKAALGEAYVCHAAYPSQLPVLVGMEGRLLWQVGEYETARCYFEAADTALRTAKAQAGVLADNLLYWLFAAVVLARRDETTVIFYRLQALEKDAAKRAVAERVYAVKYNIAQCLAAVREAGF